MQDNEIDIVELMIKSLPEETAEQTKIKLYMQVHKNNCNNFIYTNYQKETTFFNTILKSLTCDLSAEIMRTLNNKA